MERQKTTRVEYSQFVQNDIRRIVLNGADESDKRAKLRKRNVQRVKDNVNNESNDSLRKSGIA